MAWERDLMADLALDCSHSALILLVDLHLAEVLLRPSAWILAPGLRSVLAIVVESLVLTATCSPCRQFTQWLNVTHGHSPPLAVIERRDQMWNDNNFRPCAGMHASTSWCARPHRYHLMCQKECVVYEVARPSHSD